MKNPFSTRCALLREPYSKALAITARVMRLLVLVPFCGSQVFAQEFAGAFTSVEHVADEMLGHDVTILGEIHDNPVHHLNQSLLVEALAPQAIIWEMITQDQAETLSAEVLSDPIRTAETLNWATSGWPDFSLYAPVFQAAADAKHFGALVPRSAAGEIMAQGGAAWFGETAVQYGLDQALPEVEQTVREEEQQINHCNAMPAEMLPILVDFQRLRDTVLASAVVRAMEETGGPVVVITGNGHARKDRGVPVYLEKARPGLSVFVVGQAEEGQINDAFDAFLDAPAAIRPDPCQAFQSQKGD